MESLSQPASPVASKPSRTARHVCGFSDKGQFTQLGHIPGGRRPLLREGGPISYEPGPSRSSSPFSVLHPIPFTLHPAPVASKPSRTARHVCGFSDKGQFTQIGHIPGGRRPLLREGGPISYEPGPSRSSSPFSILHPTPFTLRRSPRSPRARRATSASTHTLAHSLTHSTHTLSHSLTHSPTAWGLFLMSEVPV